MTEIRPLEATSGTYGSCIFVVYCRITVEIHAPF